MTATPTQHRGQASAHDAAGPARTDPERRWAVLAVMVLCLLVVVLDNTVLNVALPRIQQELGASQSQQEWIVDAYTLVFAALLLPYGVLADRYGRRRLLLAGLSVFGLASLAAAYANSPTQLVAWRAAMALGGATVLPATLSIITNVFDEAERARAIAVWAGATGLAAAIGPLVGGALLDAGFWWGSVLLVNVPIVAAALVGIVRLVPESRDPHPRRLDLPGVLLSIVGLVTLVYGIIHAGQTGTWTAAGTLGFIVAGLVLIAAFLRVEARSSHAALDLAWFRLPAFSVASAAIGLTFFAMFGALLIGMYYLQFDRGYTPLGAGVLMLGNAIAAGMSAPLSAQMAARRGPRVVCAFGLLLLAVSFAFMATWTHTTSVALVELGMIGLGIGTGCVIAPATESIMSTLPKERAAAGSAVNSTVRQLGGALGVAVLGSVLSTSYRSQVADALVVLPEPVRRTAGESIGATQFVATAGADRLPDHGASLLQAASDSFVTSVHLTSAISAAVLVLGAAAVLTWLPQRRPAVAVQVPAPTERRLAGFAAVCACSPVCPPRDTVAADACGCDSDAPTAPTTLGGLGMDATNPPGAIAAAAIPRRLAAKGGLVGGIIGAVCCMVGAIAVGAGLAGASFATTLMDRYQIWAIVASVGFLAAWLVHVARTTGIHRADFRRHGRRLARHGAIMAGTYGATLVVAFAVSGAIRSLG